MVAALILIGAALLAMAFRGAYVAASESPQHAVMGEAERLLDDHWAKNGKHPDSLDSLPFKFHGDGEQSTIALLHYKSDGVSYELATNGVISGREIRVSRPAH